MRLLGIDPGPEESAYVDYDASDGYIWRYAKLPNKVVLARICDEGPQRLAVEMIASYGMPVGAETFETCVWIGRFIELWERSGGGRLPRKDAELVYRLDVKKHICHDGRAKDPNVRQALIDRYGGKEKAIGRKATPGPLYGLTGDCWAALGVAITAAER